MKFRNAKSSVKFLSMVGLWLTFCAVAVGGDAGRGDKSQASRNSGDDAPGVNVERRVLAADSNIRQLLESRLGRGRVAEGARFKVSYLDSAGFGKRSVIDQLEASASAQSKDFFDPWADPNVPDGPGGPPGQEGITTAYCKPFQGPGNIVVNGNVTWTWAWMPTGDTNGDGRRNTSDSCPCQWELTSVDVEHHVEGLPLEC